MVKKIIKKLVKIISGWWCAIDLGTTTCSIGIFDPAISEPRVLKNKEGDFQTLSAAMMKDGKITVGKDAKNSSLIYPDDVILRYKRCMGELMPDGKKFAPCFKDYLPQEVSSWVIKKLKSDAEAQLGEKLENAVISVPAYFNHNARKATEEAGLIAGFEKVVLINEPTAALLNVSHEVKEEKKVLIWDNGGGTLDCTFAAIKYGGNIKCIRSGGTKEGCSGEDIDAAITRFMVEEFANKGVDIDPVDDVVIMQKLREIAKKIKERLSDKGKDYLAAEVKGKQLAQEFSRDDLKRICKDIIKKAKEVTLGVLKEEGIDWKDIDKIYMGGGSSKIPFFKEMLQEISGKEPEIISSPELAVNLGAIIYANQKKAELGGDKPPVDISFEDVTTHPIGVAAVDKSDGKEKNSMIIPSASTIPIELKQVYSLHHASQTSASIRILEGDNGKLAKECNEVLDVKLNNLPPDMTLPERIEVTIIIDNSQIMHVKGRDLTSGISTGDNINYTAGLTKKEINERKDFLDKNFKGGAA
jgi:molecular chaperone DnaK